MKKILITLVLLACVAGGGYFWWQSQQKTQQVAPAQQQQQQIRPASTMFPVVQDITIFQEATGQTESVEKVDIVARVAGFLETVNFQDGADVKKGDLLFTIEKDSYKATLEEAEAQVKSREAELSRAEADLSRFKEAIQTNAVSKQDLTTKQAEYSQAQAAVMASKAALDNAKLNLSYTDIVSPIDGRINRNMVDKGNLVGSAGNTILATVVDLTPMYIYFNVSETIISQIAADIVDPNTKVFFYFGVMEEDGFPRQGELTYIDNMVDPDTGTILLRGTFDNTDHALLPGMFVRLKISVAKKENALLVKDTALLTDIGGKYLLIVDDENTVKRCPVIIGDLIGDLRVIESGLTPETRYINTGLQFLYPGMKVNPQPAQQPSAAAQRPDKKVL